MAAATLFTAAPVAAQGQEARLTPATGTQGRVAMRGGHDGRTAWMTVEHRNLQLQKRFAAETGIAVAELRAGRDHVTVTAAPAFIRVARDGHTVTLDSPAAVERAVALIGGSQAIFAARILLAELEATSALDPPDVSLLSTLAFVASLVGDVEAPRRVADRVVAKHRGFVRPVVLSGGSCWMSYLSEVTAAWNDLQGCMEESYDDPWWWSPFARLACNAIWALRAESAWFEYLKCLSPASSVSH